MFKIIKHLQRFPTQVARFYFKQLLHAVSFMHSKNICHRDLKLENLLLDKHYNLKVADFGFGTLLSRGQLKTNLGTQTYKAPEINHGEQYEGTQVDVFAIGVILFIMVTGSYPFSFASRDDMVYKLLLINQIDSFWRQQYEWNKQKDINFDQDFKDIIVGMLHPDCQQRFTISQCLQHPWSNGETLTLEQIQQFLKEQKLKFPQRRAQTERPQQQQGQIGRFKSISSTDETNDITSIENSRKLDFTNRKLIKINEDEEELIQKLISYKKPDYLFLSLIKEIENLNWQIQLIPEDTYDLIVEVIQDEETILEMYIEFERIDNDRIYVNVMKKVGNYLDFQDFKSKIEDIVQNI